MRFLIDMGLSVAVAAWLREAGHDAVHLRELGLQRMSDSDAFAKAAGEGRIVVTCDLDFGEILAATGSRTVSVVLFRIENANAPRAIAHLESLLRNSSQVLEQGAIVVIEEARHRIRRLPIGG
jgi:predicted nuclease of predicted toxin-antitoxin system